MTFPCVEVIAATVEQEPIVANMLELYIHDFSEFLSLEIGPDGRFGYPQLALYWSEPKHYPFLIRVEGKWAGLALVRKGSVVSEDQEVWDLTEFFILRGYRRRGAGTRAAHELWRRLPGRWEVRVMQSNTPALRFWAEATAIYAGKVIDPVAWGEEGKRFRVFALIG